MRILMVLTNSKKLLQCTAMHTGFDAGEATEAWRVFKEAGLEIDVASIRGGDAPVDEGSLERECKNEAVQKALPDLMHAARESKKLADCKADDYAAIYFPGGHGPMFDLPDNPVLEKMCERVYERGGFLGAICHGAVGFVDAKLSNGQYLVSGKRVCCWSNEEEKAAGCDKEVPFMLEDRLRARGAHVHNAPPKQRNVQHDVSGRIVTGQNPASAVACAEALVAALQKAGAGQTKAQEPQQQQAKTA